LVKILLSTLPKEGIYKDWQTPEKLEPFAINKFMPLGILSLATNITDDHDIFIIDPVSEGWNIDKTISTIESINPDILGLSATTRFVYPLKEILSRTTIKYKVVGGPHTTYHSKEILDFGADAVFIGPLADKEFNDAIKSRPKGIIYCKTSINEIKYPNRELLDIKKYFPKDFVFFKAKSRLPMFSSIGCPNKCIFCTIQTKKIQYKNSKMVIDEMEYLNSLDCNNVHILDDNFNINRNHVISILDEMKRRNFYTEWSGRGQTKMDLSLVKRMSEFGFKRIHVGIESLDNKLLKYLNKNETYDDINKFCIEMNKYNIDIIAFLILGIPGETVEYRKNLARNLDNLGIKHPLLNILFPDPDTKYYRDLIKEGLYKKDYWAEYMKNPTPDFEIPYPYSKKFKEDVWNCVQGIVDKL
jgi:radical SAM superfamily enzyme YgiQ (UPF0313 family)